MRFRKLSDTYEFDWKFYIFVLGTAALIVGVPYFAKQSYNRSRGAEVQALLDRENLATMEAYRKQARNWVNNRTHGHTLTAKERETAEEIMALGLQKYVTTWMHGRIHSKSKRETDLKQDQAIESALVELDAYLTSIGKNRL